MNSYDRILKEEVLDEVCSLADKRMQGAEAEEAKLFIRTFYSDVSSDDMLGRETENLYGSALSLLSFSRKRQPGQVLLRAYNPRVKKNGWHSFHTVVEIVNDDMPFLVDSTIRELARLNMTSHLVVHPVLTVQRDEAGERCRILPPQKDSQEIVTESLIHVEVDERTSLSSLRALEKNLLRILGDVRSSVDDWIPMRERVLHVLEELETSSEKKNPMVQEVGAFLRWIYEDHYTFLGYRQIVYDWEGDRCRIWIRDGTGLGVLRSSDVQIFGRTINLDKTVSRLCLRHEDQDLLRIVKSSERATVHRRSLMDVLLIRSYDEKGRPVGEHRFAGLLTSAAYSQSAQDIPILRLKIKTVLEESGFRKAGHNAKALLHVLETYPRDELFQTDIQTLETITLGIIHLLERQQVSLFVRHDPFERFVHALVYVPRDMVSAVLREKMGCFLMRAFNGFAVSQRTYTGMGEEPLARIHYTVNTTTIPSYDLNQIRQQLVNIGRSWNEKLQLALVNSDGEERGLELYHTYVSSFPLAYKEEFNVHNAVFDIHYLEKAMETGELEASLYQPIEARSGQLGLRLYSHGKVLILSEIIPLIENMGLMVIEETPFEFRLEGKELNTKTTTHNFLLNTSHRHINIDDVHETFHESFKRVWRGDLESDGYNRLVLLCGLDWRDVMFIRACSKYLQQVGITFSQSYMQETLAKNAHLVADIVQYFKKIFDPRNPIDQRREEGLLNIIKIKLDTVDSLDEDRILRRFVNVVQAMVRTNFFQNAPYLVFKFDGHKLTDLPKPVPSREIFFYSPRVEAIHLRFGAVARGGLRWSTRKEDFRTEVLSLVKAQQVKNSVIVPVGSKGGFVLKRQFSSRERLQQEGKECYRLFMEGMLSITDNIVGQRVVPPENVVRKDDDDPYLVVAADKGTATFSDYANSISEERRFWLGDAFASGGSAGYDHKVMGITARGVMVSVARHFREMDVNIFKDSVTVVGVGDMSGDVFGNGMLLSETFKLVAAFNHNHIFIDPTPDPETSFQERQRLFALPSSGWNDYASQLISSGGGVFKRTAKSIQVSPEMANLLGCSQLRVTPENLIRLILKAPVDFLWFGGIGTYIKSKTESDLLVGDRNSDALRINASEMRCRVVGEGANLGMTQSARVVFSLQGGRCNTDAIDNSAGVDCSDHEVNIKILLNEVMRRGDMTFKQRNKLLNEMTDDVAALVLRDNYQQTQSLSVMEAYASEEIDTHQRLMHNLERYGHLERDVEFLPSDEELGSRAEKKQSLTRPELAIVLAYSKNTLYRTLLKSALPDEPLLENDLISYFPQRVREAFRQDILAHKLRREIIATVVTNSMTNRTGPEFASEMHARTGQDLSMVTRCYLIVRNVFDLRTLWTSIEDLDYKVPSHVQISMLHETKSLMYRMTEWFLRNESNNLSIAENVEKYKAGVQELGAHLDDVLDSDVLKQMQERAQNMEAPYDVALRVAQLKVLATACDVVKLSACTHRTVLEAGRVYARVGARFFLDHLRSACGRFPAPSVWHRTASRDLREDFLSLQTALTLEILEGAKDCDVSQALHLWLEAHQELMERVDSLLRDIKTARQIDLAMLTVAERTMRSLLSREGKARAA